MEETTLSPEARFLIDFNVYQVPAIVGLETPPAAAAEMVGISEAEFRAYEVEVETEVRRSAVTMLSDPEMADGIDLLPLPAGGTVMAVGDSITTYRFGYARLLEAMVALRRPDDGIRFLNVAQSGYTSSDCVENTFTQFLAQEPDVVFIKLGVNDCKLFGGRSAKRLVSLEEYRANMGAMVGAFLDHTPARPILITPVPIVEAVANGNSDFQAMRMSWRNDDIKATVDVVKELAGQHGLTYIDLVEAFGETPDPTRYLADGLHPGPDGHRLILESLLRGLSDR